MLDTYKDIVTKLSPILPTYYELMKDSSAQFPCITYNQSNNYRIIGANDYGEYSGIGFYIKLWGTDIGELNTKANLVDTAMRELGYVRQSCNILTDNNIIQMVLLYEGLGFEKF